MIDNIRLAVSNQPNDTYYCQYINVADRLTLVFYHTHKNTVKDTFTRELPKQLNDQSKILNE